MATLLDAITGQEPWRQDARCLGTDPDLFFPIGSAHIDLRAREICNACPVRAECLDYAITNNEQHGVWGGLSTRERRRLADSKPVRAPRPRAVRRVVRHSAPKLAPCGTRAGYRRHLFDKEPTCQSCRAAHAEYKRAGRRRERRQEAAA